MEKPWRVVDNANGVDDDYATEDEALAVAEELLDSYRAQARDDEEWDLEVEGLCVFRLCHAAKVTKREKDEDENERVDYGMVPVPQTLPPMDGEMAWILGRPNFTLSGIARRLREMGHAIKERSEDEQAAVIYWMLNLYLQHGAAWRDEAEKVLVQKEAQTEPA